MMVWEKEDDLPDTPEVHGDGCNCGATPNAHHSPFCPVTADRLGDSAPSRAAQLDARDDFNADYDARADALIEAHQANPLCISCEREIADGDVMRATLVYPLARLAHEGECSAAAFGFYGRAVGKYGARGMRALKIGRAT